MDYEFLKQIIDKVSEYERSMLNEEELTLEGFSNFMLLNTIRNSPVQSKPISGREGGIGQLIGLMYRYAKNYSKKALKDTPFQTLDEFTYLASLLESEMTKTQLIAKHVQEKTTGMAIIQRLLRQGWIAQSENESDGRSQMIHLTDEGRFILRGGFAAMGKVSRIVTAHLSDTEKTELIRILEKLEFFHRDIFNNEKNINLDTVIQKYKI